MTASNRRRGPAPPPPPPPPPPPRDGNSDSSAMPMSLLPVLCACPRPVRGGGRSACPPGPRPAAVASSSAAARDRGPGAAVGEASARCRAAVGGSVGASAATRGDAAANDESQCLRAGVEDRARCDGPGRSRSRRAWDRVVSGEWALQDRWRSASRTCEHSLTLGFDAREKRGDELAARLESLGGDGRGRGRTRRAVRRRVRQQPRRDGVQRHGRILREGSAKRGDGSASRGRKRRRVGEHGGRGQVP